MHAERSLDIGQCLDLFSSCLKTISHIYWRQQKIWACKLFDVCISIFRFVDNMLLRYIPFVHLFVRLTGEKRLQSILLIMAIFVMGFTMAMLINVEGLIDAMADGAVAVKSPFAIHFGDWGRRPRSWKRSWRHIRFSSQRNRNKFMHHFYRSACIIIEWFSLPPSQYFISAFLFTFDKYTDHKGFTDAWYNRNPIMFFLNVFIIEGIMDIAF